MDIASGGGSGKWCIITKSFLFVLFKFSFSRYLFGILPLTRVYQISNSITQIDILTQRKRKHTYMFIHLITSGTGPDFPYSVESANYFLFGSEKICYCFYSLVGDCAKFQI